MSKDDKFSDIGQAVEAAKAAALVGRVGWSPDYVSGPVSSIAESVTGLVAHEYARGYREGYEAFRREMVEGLRAKRDELNRAVEDSADAQREMCPEDTCDGVWLGDGARCSHCRAFCEGRRLERGAIVAWCEKFLNQMRRTPAVSDDEYGGAVQLASSIRNGEHEKGEDK